MLRFENFDYNRKINSFYALEAVYDANCCCSASWNCFADLTSTSILVLQILEGSIWSSVRTPICADHRCLPAEELLLL